MRPLSIAGRALCLLLLLPSALLAAAPARQTVRVRLLELHEPNAVTVTARDGALALYDAAGEAPLATLRTGEQAVLTVSNGKVYVRLGAQGLHAAVLRVAATDGAASEVEVVEGRNRPKPFRYPGQLIVEPDPAAKMRLKLVNEVALEDYVAAVVQREYGFDDGQGAMAMAVVIRTYTLGVVGKYGPHYDHVDHSSSQLYHGIGGVAPGIREAARRTAGEVLTYNGALIRAFYFSSSGGHTASNETVWQGAPLPYLRGRPDPSDRASPHAHWKSELPADRLFEVLERQYKVEVTGIELGERGADNRVQTVGLRKPDGSLRAVRSNDFRLLLMRAFGATALRSTNFTARRVGEAYVFEGSGNGHGVGMSQWGAHELARQGRGYREILDSYYTGVTLTHLEPAAGTAPAARSTVRPAAPTGATPVPASGRIGW